ncbi:MAG: hypothetical protein LBI55_02200 [Oscillospiraceae bacterium]|jgi:penicillin-binding protein 2|nr:hypothetical protein [Oscillospiraceae bacterium]
MLKNNISKPRLLFFIFLISIFFIGFIYRLIDWQIINGEELRIRANFNTIYYVPVKSARGEILDENGVSLAVNKVVYQVVFDRFKIREDTINEEIKFLIELFKKKKQKWVDKLPISIKNGQFVFSEPLKPNDEEEKKKIEKEIEKLKSPEVLNLNSYATASDCMESMISKYKISREHDSEMLRNISSVRFNMTKSGFDSGKSKSHVFASDLSEEIIPIVGGISEGNSFRINPAKKREVVNSTLIPHILGIVGKLTQSDYEDLKDKGYGLDDTIGQYGVERALEKELRGKDGKKVVEITKEGEIKSELNKEEVVNGKTVFLTINAQLQKVLNESLKRNVLASESKKCGGAVVLDVSDFSILAASSFPSYDLAEYQKSNDYYNSLVNDNVNKPLLNRAFDDAYEPGSAFKPIVALAGLQEGIINPQCSVHCSSGWYIPGSSHRVPCMGSHGDIKLQNAISLSCNAFFLDTAYKLGIYKINEYAKKFGIGIKTGVEIHETKGSLASPERRKELGGKWFPADVAFAGIGQSDNMLSPLQLATFVATIASNGRRCNTHIVKEIKDHGRKDVIFKNDPENPQVVEDSGISIDHFNSVKAGMRQASLRGTARNPFASFNFEVYSKTGTAQNPSGVDHKVYIGFLPHEVDGKMRTIAVAVVIAQGGTYDHGYKYVAKDVYNYFVKGVGKDAKFD